MVGCARRLTGPCTAGFFCPEGANSSQAYVSSCPRCFTITLCSCFLCVSSTLAQVLKAPRPPRALPTSTPQPLLSSWTVHALLTQCPTRGTPSLHALCRRLLPPPPHTPSHTSLSCARPAGLRVGAMRALATLPPTTAPRAPLSPWMCQKAATQLAVLWTRPIVGRGSSSVSRGFVALWASRSVVVRACACASSDTPSITQR